jgi:hypothetical protein
MMDFVVLVLDHRFVAFHNTVARTFRMLSVTFSFRRRRCCVTGGDNDPGLPMLACLKTVSYHRPLYTRMPPLPSGGCIVTSLPPPSSSGIAAAAPMVASSAASFLIGLAT